MKGKIVKFLPVTLFLCALVTGPVLTDPGAVAEPPPDSLMVRWMDGKKYILHKVEPKETLEALSRRYKVPVAEISDSNFGVRELKIGQIINIPAKRTFGQNSVPVKTLATTEKIPVYYSVKQGETMYGISKKFNKSVDELKALNELESHDLQNGQRIIIGYEEREKIIQEINSQQYGSNNTSSSNVTASSEEMTSHSDKINNITDELDESTVTISEIKKNPDGKTLLEINETGIATWIQDPQFGEDKFYALHRTAPIGTIIKVTNRMNGNFVFVKVVGVLPDTGDNNRAIIKVTQSVSKRLNALDPMFQVELTYGVLE